MIVGTIVVGAMAFGPIWFVRAGVVLSLLMAAASVYFAWREVDALTRAHQLELKGIVAANREESRRRHQESLEMIDRFEDRAGLLNGNLQRVTAALGSAHAELATMRGNAVWLRGEVAERQSRIDALNERIADLEAKRDEAEAEVLALPRYGVASNRELLPTAEELWADGNHPTIVDLTVLAFPEVREERLQA